MPIINPSSDLPTTIDHLTEQVSDSELSGLESAKPRQTKPKMIPQIVAINTRFGVSIRTPFFYEISKYKAQNPNVQNNVRQFLRILKSTTSLLS